MKKGNDAKNIFNLLKDVKNVPDPIKETGKQAAADLLEAFPVVYILLMILTLVMDNKESK